MNGATNSETSGTSLAIQWLRLHTSTAGGVGLILGQRTKILYATEHNQKKKNPPPPPPPLCIFQIGGTPEKIVPSYGRLWKKIIRQVAHQMAEIAENDRDQGTQGLP